jgi:benzoyl-CoA 2,3-epoxidase subunit B
MLTEEAHHMFVGETGVGRVIQRTAEVMNQLKTEDPARVRAAGAIDLPTIQKWLNRWFSSSVNLFGGEESSNAAQYFAQGLKGRYKEEEKYTDHVALEGHYDMPVLEGGRLTTKQVALRNAMNEVLRDDYVGDCDFVVQRWNKVLEKAERPERLTLPSRRFHRDVGIYSGKHFDPEGNPITPELWDRNRDRWLPSAADQAFVNSLMKPVLGMGQIAGWISPPRIGINGNPFEWEYVRFDKASVGVALGAKPSLIG